MLLNVCEAHGGYTFAAENTEIFDSFSSAWMLLAFKKFLPVHHPLLNLSAGCWLYCFLIEHFGDD